MNPTLVQPTTSQSQLCKENAQRIAKQYLNGSTDYVHVLDDLTRACDYTDAVHANRNLAILGTSAVWIALIIGYRMLNKKK